MLFVKCPGPVNFELPEVFPPLALQSPLVSSLQPPSAGGPGGLQLIMDVENSDGDCSFRDSIHWQLLGVRCGVVCVPLPSPFPQPPWQVNRVLHGEHP